MQIASSALRPFLYLMSSIWLVFRRAAGSVLAGLDRGFFSSVTVGVAVRFMLLVAWFRWLSVLFYLCVFSCCYVVRQLRCFSRPRVFCSCCLLVHSNCRGLAAVTCCNIFIIGLSFFWHLLQRLCSATVVPTAVTFCHCHAYRPAPLFTSISVPASVLLGVVISVVVFRVQTHENST